MKHVLFVVVIMSAVRCANADESQERTVVPDLMPEVAGPLRPATNPTKLDVGPLGDVFMTGVVTGFGQLQTNSVPGDRAVFSDLTNAQLFVQKPDGVLQFFVQSGAYSIPSLGTPYMTALTTTREQWGPVPQAFIKLVPSDDWSLMAGKLPSISGYEGSFSFQNLNIERGLLWNQSASVSRGVQVNHSAGPFTFALSWNDGFYSDQMTWISGSTVWKIDETNSFTILGGANTRTTSVSTIATPVLQNNSRIFDLIYTCRSGPWSLSPYLQYTYVPVAPSIGVLHDAATYGASLLVNYSFDPTVKLGSFSFAGLSLPFRIEYITSTGTTANGAPNLLYGPGSAAWSFTVTPTYQYERFFTRAEVSYVAASHTTPGLAFGSNGSEVSQARFAVEAGFLF
jgi:Putative beta-barrel porin-2, OmpL-like. bbp2